MLKNIFLGVIVCVLSMKIFAQNHTQIIIRKINLYADENIFPLLLEERHKFIQKMKKEDIKQWNELQRERKNYTLQRKNWFLLKDEEAIKVWEELQKKDKIQWQKATILAEKYDKIWSKEHLPVIEKSKIVWDLEAQNIINRHQKKLDTQTFQLFKKYNWGKYLVLTDLLLEYFETPVIIENEADAGE
jgi:hypothetical protein